ncbi:MAG: hypothetical protein KDC92_07095 [Bacteroidetes bacterium]|nr:hypothetical protein [Bacteroidota bacterium]
MKLIVLVAFALCVTFNVYAHHNPSIGLVPSNGVAVGLVSQKPNSLVFESLFIQTRFSAINEDQIIMSLNSGDEINCFLNSKMGRAGAYYLSNKRWSAYAGFQFGVDIINHYKMPTTFVINQFEQQWNLNGVLLQFNYLVLNTLNSKFVINTGITSPVSKSVFNSAIKGSNKFLPQIRCTFLHQSNKSAFQVSAGYVLGAQLGTELYNGSQKLATADYYFQWLNQSKDSSSNKMSLGISSILGMQYQSQIAQLPLNDWQDELVTFKLGFQAIVNQQIIIPINYQIPLYQSRTDQNNSVSGVWQIGVLFKIQ